jgi:hypothetical protein
MARTALTPVAIVRAGISAALGAANADGHSCVNDGKTFLDVNNGGAGALNVSLVISETVDGYTPGPRVVNFNAGVEKLIGPFPVNIYGATLTIDFDEVDTVTIGAFKLP